MSRSVCQRFRRRSSIGTSTPRHLGLQRVCRPTTYTGLYVAEFDHVLETTIGNSDTDGPPHTFGLRPGPQLVAQP